MSGPVKERRDTSSLLALLSAISLALLTILSVWKLKQFKYRLIHETGGAMLYGMLLGLAVKYWPLNQGEQNVEHVCSCVGLNSTPHILTINTTSHVHCYRHVGKLNQRCPLVLAPHTETFDPEVLFNLFLSPIIFHGAYTLNQRRFIDNLGSILTFAFLGTIISCLTIGACVYGFTRLMVLLGRAADGDFVLSDCLLFGAIMSATDPVSVISLLSELRVDLNLHALLFGESVLNDAVAIVLTHAITTYNMMGAGHTFDPSAFLHSVGYFLGVLAGSFLMGFIFTVLTALFTKFTRLHESPLLETSVFFLLSFCSFLSAEASGLSGIVAVLFCGMSQARYTFHNLSTEGRSRTKQFFEIFNFLGEIFIFSYMGYVLLTFPHHVFKALFISGAFLSIFISRACNIYPLSFLLNLGRTNKIPRSFQHFMMFAGLRGAVTFSLAIHLDRSKEARRTILTTTLLLVCFTIWVLGAAADPVLRSLDIRFGEDADEIPEDQLSSEVSARRPDTTPGLWHRLDFNLGLRLLMTNVSLLSTDLDQIVKAIFIVVAQVVCTLFSGYVRPMLTHCGPPLTDSLPQCCQVFARLFSSSHVHEDEEQLCETEPDESTVDLKTTENELISIGGDSGSEHQEDLVEGDLGLGTAPALAREA